jgi:hypothetical protein
MSVWAWVILFLIDFALNFGSAIGLQLDDGCYFTFHQAACGIPRRPRCAEAELLR